MPNGSTLGRAASEFAGPSSPAAAGRRTSISVRSPSASCRTVPPAASTPVTPKAAVKPLNASRVLVLPSGKRCLSRRTITLHLRLPAGAVAKTVSVKIGTQKPTVFSGRRLKAPINLRGLRKGAYTVTVTLRTTDGRSASLKRAYRTCTIKKRR